MSGGTQLATGFASKESFDRTPSSYIDPVAPLLIEQSPIYASASACRRKFEELSRVLHGIFTNREDKLAFNLDYTHNSVEDAKARFKAWGTNIAAFRHGTLRTSLDFRLSKAPGIRDSTLQVLGDLEEYLTEVTSIVTGKKGNSTWDSANGSDSSDYSDNDDVEVNYKKEKSEDMNTGSELGELLKAITASNGSLMKISILVRSSATRDDYVKAASRFKDWSPYPDIGHVREKYGAARHGSPWLIERLGKAITRRRQFLRYRVEHHYKLTEAGADDEGVREKPEKTIASTKATTFIGANAPQVVHAAGSDAGNSFGSGTSYQATIFEADGGPTLLNVPPPPKFAFPDVQFEYGEPFQCPYCFTEQSVKNKSDWKKHVFRDLKPYVCTFEGCGMSMFRSWNEWFSHELQIHRREWICQFCVHAAFDNISAFSKHTESSHRAVLASSSLKALILQCEEPVDKIPATACPLCDDWEADLKQKHAALESILAPADTPGKEDVYGKPKLFRRHLGRHMEQLALFALPSSNTGDLEDESTDGELEAPEVYHDDPHAGDDESSESEDEELDQIFESRYRNTVPMPGAEPPHERTSSMDSWRKLSGKDEDAISPPISPTISVSSTISDDSFSNPKPSEPENYTNRDENAKATINLRESTANTTTERVERAVKGDEKILAKDSTSHPEQLQGSAEKINTKFTPEEWDGQFERQSFQPEQREEYRYTRPDDQPRDLKSRPSSRRNALAGKSRIFPTIETDLEASSYGEIDTNIRPAAPNLTQDPILQPRASVSQTYPSRPTSYYGGIAERERGPPLSSSAYFGKQPTLTPSYPPPPPPPPPGYFDPRRTSRPLSQRFDASPRASSAEGARKPIVHKKKKDLYEDDYASASESARERAAPVSDPSGQRNLGSGRPKVIIEDYGSVIPPPRSTRPIIVVERNPNLNIEDDYSAMPPPPRPRPMNRPERRGAEYPIAPRNNRGNVSYYDDDSGAPVETARTTRRNPSHYGQPSTLWVDDTREQRMRDAKTYQDEVGGPPIPLTAEILRQRQRERERLAMQAEPDNTREQRDPVARAYQEGVEDSRREQRLAVQRELENTRDGTIRAAETYQEDVERRGIPLTGKILRRERGPRRYDLPSGYDRRSGTTRTTRPIVVDDDDGDITIKVTGQASVMVDGEQIDCDDGGYIDIKQSKSARKERGVVYHDGGSSVRFKYQRPIVEDVEEFETVERPNGEWEESANPFF